MNERHHPAWPAREVGVRQQREDDAADEQGQDARIREAVPPEYRGEAAGAAS